MNKPPFNFGDLVKVAGYWPRIFKVDGYRKEHYFYPGDEWTELVYELYDVETAEWLEADVEDLTLVANTEQTDENPSQEKPKTTFDGKGVFIDFSKELSEWGDVMSGVGNPKEPNKPTARELSAQEADERKRARKERAEKVDKLLDEYRDYKALADAFGDAEYCERMAEIEAELRRIGEIK